MDVAAILATLRQNKVGASLIGIQIALTLAIVCNSLSIIQQDIERMHTPAGVDEGNLFMLQNQWIDSAADVPSRTTADLTALRSIPGVIDAAAVNSVPLSGNGSSNSVKLSADQKDSNVRTALYLTGEHGLNTWGARLIAGRWFTSTEIAPLQSFLSGTPQLVVVTEALARDLFPRGDALGKRIWVVQRGSSEIIGIVQNVQTPWAAMGWAAAFAENSVFLPYDFAAPGSTYVVRTRPQEQRRAMQDAQKVLFDISQQRVVDHLQSFAAMRMQAYRSDRATNLILSAVSAMLLIVTGFGIVGLSTYWVAQSRRQIGIRRALGARRSQILWLFQGENLLISALGSVAGIGLALALNAWLVTGVAMTRISPTYVYVGALIVLLLSQAAVVWPALRAAAISPATAARGIG